MCFFLSVSKQLNTEVVLTISMTKMQKCVFLMLSKIWMLKCLSVTLVSGTNETRHIEWHEMCKCKYSLNGSACNDK